MHYLFLMYFVNLYVFRAYIGQSSECTTVSIYDMIYLLTAVVLSPGGSTHLHTNNIQNNTNNNQTTQIQTKCGKVRSVNRLCEFYPGSCLTTEKKASKNLSQSKKNLSQVEKILSHYTVCILPKTSTHYKTLTNTHITKPTHTPTRTYTHYNTI
jgi:cyclopropane fatty-acyl-phospholipid synthase-like methyltransferase